jgi:MFS family permease
MNSSRPAVRAGAGVLGGWLAILPPSVLTLALRKDEWSVSATTYANLLAVGWLTMLIALVVSGRLNDSLLSRTGSRLLFVRVGAPLIAVSGVLLAIAPTVNWLFAAWIFAQIPAAMVITTALAVGGDTLPVNRRGIASGLVGAAPIVALLIGGFLVRALSDSLALAFVIPALIGAAFAMPLMREQSKPREVQNEAKNSNEAEIICVSAAQPVALIWVVFVVGSFMLSWTISTTNGFIVLFAQYSTDVVNSEVTATNVVITASALAVIASLIAGLVSKGQPRALFMWVTAAFLCGLALVVLLVSPTIMSLYISATLLGLGFGMANGVELAVVLMLRRARHHLGRDLGIFTAATTAPFVLVPLVASVMVREDTGIGLTSLFALGSAVAIAAGAVVLVALLVNLRRFRAPAHT